MNASIMMKSYARFLVRLFAVWSVCVLAGESARGALVVRLLADQVDGDLGKVRLVAGSKASDPTSIPVNFLSNEVVAPDREFEIRAVEGDEVLATVKLPEKGKAFIVLLASAEGGFTPAVIPSADRSFKAGDLYLYNNSGKTVVGSVGGTKLELEEGKGLIVHPKAEEGENRYPVELSLRDESGDRVLSKTMWPVDAAVRSYVLFHFNPKKERVDYRSVDEFVRK